jgi:hypothetical protein
MVLISEETSLSALTTVFLHTISPKKLRSPQFCKISPEPKISRKYSITKNRKFPFIADEVNNVE